jgi:hypothetical protein
MWPEMLRPRIDVRKNALSSSCFLSTEKGFARWPRHAITTSEDNL